MFIIYLKIVYNIDKVLFVFSCLVLPMLVHRLSDVHPYDSRGTRYYCLYDTSFYLFAFYNLWLKAVTFECNT